jgi:hypothetical protein
VCVTGFPAPEQPEEIMAGNTFSARDRFTVDGLTYEVFRLDRLDGAARLENLLRIHMEPHTESHKKVV